MKQSDDSLFAFFVIILALILTFLFGFDDGMPTQSQIDNSPFEDNGFVSEEELNGFGENDGWEYVD